MVDLYLRFADFQQAAACLQAIGIQVGGDGLLPVDGSAQGTDFALDLVFGTGIITQPTGEPVQTPEGPVTIMAPLPGCHVNLRWRGETGPGGLEPYQIQPQSPALLWA